MEKVKCYLLAMLAMKFDAAHTDILSEVDDTIKGKILKVQYTPGESTPEHHIALMPGIATTYSEEDARQTGLTSALKQWPESEGWFGHQVNMSEIVRADIEQVLDSLPTPMAEEDKSRSDDSEPIM